MKTRLELMLDTAKRTNREITFDCDEWTKADVERLQAICRNRGFDVSGDARFVLVRPPVK